MFKQIRSWLAAHPRCALTLLVIATLGPFLAKPFNIDDPLFIQLAQHVQSHPADPFGFEVNWYGKISPMWTVTENPPVAGYYYALFGSIFGWSEISLHFAGLIAALAVILGTYRLAFRLCGQPLVAACATLLTPVFLVSANTVMCDVLMLAFWVWAVVFWVEGLQEGPHEPFIKLNYSMAAAYDRHGRSSTFGRSHSAATEPVVRPQYTKIIAAGTLVALAMLTKYFGAALIPLLAVHGALQTRKLGGWVIGLLIPLVALVFYQWFTHALYGHALFSEAASFASTAHGKLGFSKLAAALIGLSFTGGCVASSVFLAPWLWRMRSLAIIFGTAILIGGLLVWCCNVLQKFPALDDPTRAQVAIQFVFWMAGGVLVLGLLADVWQFRRDPHAWLLGLWLAGTFLFAAFGNWTVNGRTILPMVPAVGILLARRWELVGLKQPMAFKICLAISGIFALFVAQADFGLALAVRRSADEAMAKYGQGRGPIWFEGHWGFQYYLEKAGAKAVDFQNFAPASGDILVLPLHNTYVSEPPQTMVASRDAISVPASTGLATWQPELGAGFYSSVSGPLPFAFGRVPEESLYIYQLKR